MSLILSFLGGFVLGCLPFGDSWCQNQPLGKHEEGKSKPRWARGPDWMGQAGPIQPMPKSCPAVLPESGSSFQTGPAEPGGSDSACPELPPASGKSRGLQIIHQADNGDMVESAGLRGLLWSQNWELWVLHDKCKVRESTTETGPSPSFHFPMVF